LLRGTLVLRECGQARRQARNGSDAQVTFNCVQARAAERHTWKEAVTLRSSLLCVNKRSPKFSNHYREVICIRACMFGSGDSRPCDVRPSPGHHGVQSEPPIPANPALEID
jgi:hypothetical protein